MPSTSSTPGRSTRTRTPTTSTSVQHGPVWREPHQGVVMVTGYEEALAVYHDTETFSNANVVTGPFARWPVPLEGDDVSAIIEKYRDRTAVQRPAAELRSAEAHRAPLAAGAAAHAEAPQGERGVHVAARGSPDRRVPRPRGVRVHPRLREPVHAAGHRRPARRSRRAACGVPRGDAGRPRSADGRARRGGARADGLPLRAVHEVHRRAPAQPAQRRDDRDGHRDVSRRHACPRSATSC